MDGLKDEGRSSTAPPSFLFSNPAIILTAIAHIARENDKLTFTIELWKAFGVNDYVMSFLIIKKSVQMWILFKWYLDSFLHFMEAPIAKGVLNREKRKGVAKGVPARCKQRQ